MYLHVSLDSRVAIWVWLGWAWATPHWRGECICAHVCFYRVALYAYQKSTLLQIESFLHCKCVQTMPTRQWQGQMKTLSLSSLPCSNPHHCSLTQAHPAKSCMPLVIMSTVYHVSSFISPPHLTGWGYCSDVSILPWPLQCGENTSQGRGHCQHH